MANRAQERGQLIETIWTQLVGFALHTRENGLKVNSKNNSNKFKNIIYN